MRPAWGPHGFSVSYVMLFSRLFRQICRDSVGGAVAVDGSRNYTSGITCALSAGEKSAQFLVGERLRSRGIRRGDDVRVSAPISTASLVRKPRFLRSKSLKPCCRRRAIPLGSSLSMRAGWIRGAYEVAGGRPTDARPRNRPCAAPERSECAPPPPVKPFRCAPGSASSSGSRCPPLPRGHPRAESRQPCLNWPSGCRGLRATCR